MENTSEFIATINEEPIEEITNNGTISINNLKVLMKINNIIDTPLFKDENGELHIPKRSIITIDYNEANKEVNFTYSYRRSMKNVYVRFDDKSQSAYDSFKKTLLELNKVKGVLYYPNSGNIRMEGEFTIDEESGRYSANGDAMVYYDTPEKTIYYNGEIENENYDGKGVFYNIYGNISLEINNIDQNNPIGNGTLTIKNHLRQDVYKKVIDFNKLNEIDLSNHFDIHQFIKIHNDDIFSDFGNYTEFMKVYEIEKNITNELSDTKTNDEKFDMLYRKVYSMENKMNELLEKLCEVHSLISKQNEKKGFFGVI